MKIGVTGGTGFLGGHLVDRLAAKGHQLSILSHRRQVGAGDSITEVSGSITDGDSLKALCHGCDLVYHMVGIIVATGGNSFDRTVALGTENLVKACQMSKVGRIAYVSALGTSEEARSKYHQTKYAAEQTIMGSGLEYTILRPSVIYGRGDGFITLLSQLLRWSPLTPIIGTGRYKLQPVYIEDLLDVMERCCRPTELLNETIDIAGPEKLEYLQIIAILKELLQKKRLNVFIPTPVMKAVAMVLEILPGKPAVTRDQIKMMETGNTGDISRMKEILNREPISLNEGLRKYLKL